MKATLGQDRATMGTKTDESIKPSQTARSIEELFPLIEYCRAGKLKEVKEWISAGNPLDPPQNAKRSRRPSPLEIAIEKGFFALAELLLEGGSDPAANRNILSLAVRCREVEIAKLLLDRGASTKSVWVDEIFEGGAGMLKLFIAHGFDPTTDLAYYNALCRRVHPLLFVLKEFKEQFPDLQRQAEMALCHYCKEGTLRAVSLLLWAGARAEALVPNPHHPDDSELATTPIEEAVYAGHLDVLKRLKPQNFPEHLQRLADSAWLRPSQGIFDYLLSLGAPLNTKPGGGSKLLDGLIWRLNSSARPVTGIPRPSEMDETLGFIEFLVSRGAKWIPNSDESIRDSRAHLRHLDADRLVALFRILKEGEGASIDFLESLLESPSFRKRLGDRLKALEKILHPPLPKPVFVSASVASMEKEAPRPRPSISELCPGAEQLLLNILRQYPAPHFTQLSVSDSIYAHTARRSLGLSRGDSEDLMPIFAKAIQNLNKRLKAFSIETETGEWLRGSKGFTARLEQGMEWPDAVKEAWASAQTPNECLLTDAGIRLLSLVRTTQFEEGFFEEEKLLASIGARKRDQYARGPGFENFLHELVLKAGIPIRWEVKRDRTYGPLSFRVWIDVGQDQEKSARGFNPRIETDLAHFKKGDLDGMRALIDQLIIDAAPTGTEPFYVLHITSRREFEKCFAKPQEVEGGTVAEFLCAVPLNETVGHSYDFRSSAPCWFFALIPKTDWPTSIAAIEHERSQPTLEQRFGISSDAAKIIVWIESLGPGEFESCYTPVVEDMCERRIGLESPWSHENFSAYIQALVEEINEKTHYNLKLQAWNNYSQVNWRIRVGRKKTDMEDILRQLHWTAWKRGVTLDLSLARQTLEGLLSGTSQSPRVE